MVSLQLTMKNSKAASGLINTFLWWPDFIITKLLPESLLICIILKQWRWRISNYNIFQYGSVTLLFHWANLLFVKHFNILFDFVFLSCVDCGTVECTQHTLFNCLNLRHFVFILLFFDNYSIWFSESDGVLCLLVLFTSNDHKEGKRNQRY